MPSNNSPMIIKTDNTTEVARVDSSGNIGIGTTTPGASLEVAGTGAKFSGTLATETPPDAYLYAGVFASTPRIIFGGSTIREIDNAGGALRFFRPGLVDMIIDSSGNVGIGTWTPGTKLDIASGPFNGIRLGNGTNYGHIFNDGNLHIESAAGTPLWINGDNNGPVYINNAGGTTVLNPNGGNVGIGNTSPGEKLHVTGNEGAPAIGSNNTGLAWFSENSGGNGINIGYHYAGASNYGWIQAQFIGNIAAYYSLALNPQGGNVGIGTATPSAKLTVQGDVSVSGHVFSTGADCAEEFDIAETVGIEPGTVMVIDQDGTLHPCRQAYDKRVAGVVSGAGDYQPSLILDRRQAQDSRVPVALVGKVYCRVDAQYAPIEMGDLLTTSSTAGHAMKAEDPLKAFGAVLGKALRALPSGQGLIPILVALQ